MHAGLGHAWTAGAERVLTRHYSAGMPGHGAQAYRPFAGQPTHEDMRQSLIAKIRVLVAADSSPDLTCVRATHIDLSYQPIFTSLRAPLIPGTSTQSTSTLLQNMYRAPPRIRENLQNRRGWEEPMPSTCAPPGVPLCPPAPSTTTSTAGRACLVPKGLSVPSPRAGPVC